MNEKIQKILANTGLGSRRKIEEWIKEGRVTVKGKLATIGMRVNNAFNIALDGIPVKITDIKTRDRIPSLVMYHKPAGEICTRENTSNHPTVFDNLPVLQGKRWISIGRLDLNTSGLLLFTTQGELANYLQHPSSGFEREYAVRVLGVVTRKVINKLIEGVELEDGLSSFIKVEDAGGEGANHWYKVTLKRGRQREVRRLWESQGLKVSRLIRIRFANILLPHGLRVGKWQPVEEEQLEILLPTGQNFTKEY